MTFALHGIPLALDSGNAAWVAFSGTLDQSTEAQRHLLGTIEEIPVVGKKAAHFAEWFGTKLAHMTGHQSLKEREADLEAHKKILENFATSTKKLGTDVGKLSDEAALLGLTPSHAQ